MLQEDVVAPPVVKEVHSKWWWTTFALVVILCVFEIIATEVFDAIMSAILAIVMFYMLRQNCSQMSKYCLILFGTICIIQAIFQIIELCSSVGGRSIRHTVRSEIENQVIYTTTVETHPFFDHTQGFVYNSKSAVLIAGPTIMLTSTFLSYYSYKAFPAMGEEDASVPVNDGQRGGGGNGFGRGLMYSGEGQQPGGGGGGGRVIQGGRVMQGGAGRPQMFQGSGQRLGSN